MGAFGLKKSRRLYSREDSAARRVAGKAKRIGLPDKVKPTKTASGANCRAATRSWCEHLPRVQSPGRSHGGRPAGYIREEALCHELVQRADGARLEAQNQFVCDVQHRKSRRASHASRFNLQTIRGRSDVSAGQQHSQLRNWTGLRGARWQGPGHKGHKTTPGVCRAARIAGINGFG